MKVEEVRVFAFEDGPFRSSSRVELRRGGKAYLVGVLTRGFKIEDLALTLITVDGLDGTGKLLELCETRMGQFDLVMLASLAYAGFNLIDPEEVHRRLKVPVVVVNPRRPRREAVRRALLKHFEDWSLRLKVLEKAGEPWRVKLATGEAYALNFGISRSEAEQLIRGLAVFGNRPEPLRVAKLIARGLGFWEEA